MRHFGCARNDGTRALSRLVAIDAALHAPGDGGAEDAAKRLLHPESALDHIHERIRHLTDMEGQHDNRKQHIEDGHERCHHLRHVGDALHAAHHHEADKQGHDAARPCRADVERVGKRGGDAVGLHRRQTQAASQHRDDGEGHREPFAVEALLDVIGRSATKLPFVLFLVDLCQSSLREGRACAEEGDDPHPDDGPRTAVADGRGNAHDVARAHAPRQRHRERLKRGNARLLRFVGREKQPRHLAQAPHLHEARPDGEIESRQKTDGH